MATTIKGYKIKNGKVVKTPPRKSVSQKIAERRNPKKRYRAATVCDIRNGGPCDGTN